MLWPQIVQAEILAVTSAMRRNSRWRNALFQANSEGSVSATATMSTTGHLSDMDALLSDWIRSPLHDSSPASTGTTTAATTTTTATTMANTANGGTANGGTATTAATAIPGNTPQLAQSTLQLPDVQLVLGFLELKARLDWVARGNSLSSSSASSVGVGAGQGMA